MQSLTEQWTEVWQENFDQTKGRQPTFDPEDYYRSGRVSKQWPTKEGPEWWIENGPAFVERWEKWRDLSGLKFAEVFNTETGEASPGIEIETYAEHENGVILKSIIDRVMEDVNGDLYIVDLKTGSMTAPWPLQMALNNLGLVASFDLRAKWAGFWSARKGGVEEWFDLSVYKDEWLWEQARMAKAIRDQQLFVASPNNLCKSACGVRAHCPAMGGTPFFRSDATVTQKRG